MDISHCKFKTTNTDSKQYVTVINTQHWISQGVNMLTDLAEWTIGYAVIPGNLSFYGLVTIKWKSLE